METENSRFRISTVWVSVLAAFQFLLVTPAFIKRPFNDEELGNSVAYYPLVGLLLGFILNLVNWIFLQIFPDLVRAALILGVWVLATGALHLDGFLDACDGLLGGSTPEKRMQIMRDERVGAFGFTGGLLLMLLKFSILASLKTGIPVFILAPVLGRWAMTAAIVFFPYARPNGLGRTIKDRAGSKQFVISSIITAAIIVGVGFNYPLAIPASSLAAAVLAGFFCASFSMRRLSGLTGDIYGATCEVIEACVLLAAITIMK